MYRRSRGEKGAAERKDNDQKCGYLKNVDEDWVASDSKLISFHVSSVDGHLPVDRCP